MKKILGLDLGTNSIGWALIEKDDKNNQGKILGMGSRIIPIGDDKGNFEAGKKLTRAAERRTARQIRRGNHRYKLRRNKLIYALSKLGMLPVSLEFGYEKKNETGLKERINGEFPEPNKLQSLFVKSLPKGFKENMTAKYFLELRKCALEKSINLKDFGRIIYLFNQRRGYSGGGDDDDNKKTNEKDEKFIKKYEIVTIQSIKPIQKTESKKKIPIWNAEIDAEITDTKTGEIKKDIIKGECYKDLEINKEVKGILIKRGKYSFINFEDAPLQYEIKKGEYDKYVINGKVINCSIAQEYYKKKPVYNLTLKDDERKGKLLLKDKKKGEEIIEELKKDNKKDIEKELEITTYFDEEGKEEKWEFALPYKSNWKKKMESIEKNIKDKIKEKEEKNELDIRGKGNYHICHYFLDEMEKSENGEQYRIRENVILRKRYQAEFEAIWKRQADCNEDFKKILVNNDLLKEIVNYVFPGQNKENKFENKQKEYREKALKEGLFTLIFDQIIYYQRPLKPQTDLIGGCQYEMEKDADGKPINRVIPRSHPLYQEFRLWKQINQIFLEEKQPEGIRPRYKKILLDNVQKRELYEELLKTKQMKFDGVVKAIGLKQQGKDEEIKYFVKGYNKNYIIGNDTLITLKKLLGNDFATLFGEDDEKIYTNTDYIDLHDIMFERIGNEMDEDDDRVKAIREFLNNRLNKQNSETDINGKALELAQFKFPRVYGSLSIKAINKILPLMKPLKEGETLAQEFKDKIDELIKLHEEYKKDFTLYTPEIEKTTKKSKALVKDFVKENRESLYNGNWPEWAAAQLLYGRHTAAEPDKIIENYHDIKQLGKKETLRNPVVEQLVNETLQLVKSIWKQYAEKPAEIRIELARELKNNAEEREKMFNGMKKAERLNKEAAYEIMLMEYKRGDKKITPKNECIADGCNSNCRAFTRIPTPNEITKYKLWKEQGFVSPYTGKPIPLCKLFDGSLYNKEHIIPKQRFFDNSNANIVIAEKAVNDAKGNWTAIEFIEHCNGGNAEGYQILPIEKYESHVRKQFHGRKQKNLLLKEIPEDFVERQKKDTQYIAIKVKEKLAEIVGLQNVTTTSGGITDYLRELWKLNNIFKELSIERYKRMALLTTEKEKEWVDKDKHNNWVLKEWSKRLDHRHHAIDALVIACTSQGQITQLNTLNQILQKTIEERKEQIRIEEGEDTMDAFLKLTKEEKQKLIGDLENLRNFKEPWKGFIADAKHNIENIVVSHKPKQRILIQNQEDKKTGKRLDKLILKVRSKLHQETIYGKKRNPNEKPILKTIKSAFELTNYIINQDIKNIINQRISKYESIEEAIASLKDEPITDFRGKKIVKVEVQFTEKDIYRFPLEKLGEKKSIKSFIEDNVVGNENKVWLLDHLYRYCFKQVIEDEEGNDFNDKIEVKNIIEKFVNQEQIIGTDIENINNKIDELYLNIKNKEIEKKLKESLNGKVAFSIDGIEELNKFRKIYKTKKGKGLPPINAIKVLYATAAGESSLQKIERNGQEDWVKTGDNYCFAILQKGNNRSYQTISFFDAVKWVTEQFRLDKINKIDFPKKHEERLKYVEEIIKKHIKKDNPNSEVLFLLQPDELVYLPIEGEEFNPPSFKDIESYKKFWFEEVMFEKEDKETNEIMAKQNKKTEQIKYFRCRRIYRVVKTDSAYCHFTPHHYAYPIWYKPLNTKEKDEIEIKRDRELPKTGLQEYDSRKNCSPFVFDDDNIKNLLIQQNIKILNKNVKESKGEEAKSIKEKAKKLSEINKSYNPVLIQKTCIKINVDRIGNIIISEIENLKKGISTVKKEEQDLAI